MNRITSILAKKSARRWLNRSGTSVRVSCLHAWTELLSELYCNSDHHFLCPSVCCCKSCATLKVGLLSRSSCIFFKLRFHVDACRQSYNVFRWYFLGIHLLSLLVPILVSCLQDSAKDRYLKTLHDSALQNLNKIGPLYPSEFRTVMQNSPHLRTRLESALKAQTASHPETKRSDNIKPITSQQPAKPSIKLKTDFSNFTGWY